MLFWLRLVLLRLVLILSIAISAALGHVTIGACHTMKRERNGNQQKQTQALLTHLGWASQEGTPGGAAPSPRLRCLVHLPLAGAFHETSHNRPHRR